MLKKILMILLTLEASVLGATSCQLTTEGDLQYKETLGLVDFIKIQPNSATTRNNHSFSSDNLYELINGNQKYYFRINYASSNNLEYMQWVNGNHPSPGKYMVKSYLNTKAREYDKTFDMIGDSITWAEYGSYFRCILKDAGLSYDFNGAFTDPFGYKHDGHGGDTTLNVLQRIKEIPISNYYFVLIGTNDHIEPRKTILNIMKISNELANKNIKAKIYISTLLPKTDAFSHINKEINQLLRSETLCSQCKLVDLGGYFESQPNWQNLLWDGVHPSIEGYKVMSNYLAPILID